MNTSSSGSVVSNVPRSVKNPWFRKDSPYSVNTYTIKNEPIFSYRGADVYKLISSWLYVLEDTAIAERAGFSKDAAPATIDLILDGGEPSSEGVVKHIRSNGFKGLTHDEYMQAWAKGEME